MITVQPMPNELAQSHAQRVQFLNGCKNRAELNGLLTREVRRRGRDPNGMLRIGELAFVSDLSQAEYVTQHSMVSAFRVAAKPGEEFPHGDPAGDSFTQMNGFRTQRSGSFVCLKCVEEDMAQWHFSWYRRTHHLAGVDWCWAHGTVLQQVKSDKHFESSPYQCVNEGKIEQVDACVSVMPAESYLARYVELSCNILLRQRPCEAAKINRLISERAQELGMRVSRIGGKKTLLSDQMRFYVPERWLHTHVPDWPKKADRQFLRFLDLPTISLTQAHSGASYVAVLAALFETTEQALLQLRSSTLSSVKPKLRPPRYEEHANGSRYWTGEFWESYVKHRGSVQKIADELHMVPNRVLIKMKRIGLPSTHGLETDPKWRALARFHKGEDLIAACTREHADLSSVLALLKIIIRPVGQMISDCLTNSGSSPSPESVLNSSGAEKKDDCDGTNSVLAPISKASPSKDVICRLPEHRAYSQFLHL